MKNLCFFAETKEGEIIQFYNITFILDNSLCAWVDKNIIKDIIYNYNANRLVNDNLFVRTKEVKSFFNSIGSSTQSAKGYIPTGYKLPTKDDIPFYSLRSVWDEVFVDAQVEF